MPETSPFSAGCQRFADLPPELAAAIFSRLSLKERCAGWPVARAALQPAVCTAFEASPGSRLPLRLSPRRYLSTLPPSHLHRHRAVPLCCRRWCLLAHMPVLLERVSVDVRGLARLQSLCAWLMFRAAGHMRELGITFCATHPFYEEESNIAAADLAAALAVCGAAGGLTLLRLFVEGMRLGTGAWLPLGLHQLRHLMLRGHTSSEEDEVLYFPSLLAPLTSMGDLETLWLEGSGSGLPDLTAGLGLLPVSLKRLHLAHPGPPALQSLEVQVGAAAGVGGWVGRYLLRCCCMPARCCPPCTIRRQCGSVSHAAELSYYRLAQPQQPGCQLTLLRTAISAAYMSAAQTHTALRPEHPTCQPVRPHFGRPVQPVRTGGAQPAAVGNLQL